MQQLSRRSLVRTAMWAVPMAAVVTAAPAYAASTPPCGPGPGVPIVTQDVGITGTLTPGTVGSGVTPSTLAYLVSTVQSDGTATPGGMLVPGMTWESRIAWRGVPAETEPPTAGYFDTAALDPALAWTFLAAEVSSPYPADPSAPDGAQLVDITATFRVDVVSLFWGDSAGVVSWAPLAPSADITYEESATTVGSGQTDPATVYTAYAVDPGTGECTQYDVRLAQMARELKIRE